MKFSIIFKEPLQRFRFVDVEAESFDALAINDQAKTFGMKTPLVYGVIDWDAQKVVPASMGGDGRVFEVPDGDFGELTPAEYFEEQS